MQHDLFRSGHDLDLRSTFELDLSRSYIPFDVPWRAKHDGVWIISLSLWEEKLLQKKNISGKFAILIWHCMTSIGWTVDLRSNLRTAYQKSVSTAIECFFSNFLAHLVPEIKRELWRDIEIAKKSQHFEFGDLCWPRFWPDPKMIWVFLVDLISTYSTPFIACRYVAPFSRSQGGLFSPPPLQFVFGSEPLQCAC